jgi:hypothetical protein
MDNDFYSDSNLEYQKAQAYPTVSCPTEEMIFSYSEKMIVHNESKINSKYEYINANQEIVFISSDEDFTISDLNDRIITKKSDNQVSCLDYSIENDRIFYSSDKLKDIRDLYDQAINSISKTTKSFKEVK